MDRNAGPYVFATVAGRVEAFATRVGERLEPVRESRANFAPKAEPAGVRYELTPAQRTTAIEHLQKRLNARTSSGALLVRPALLDFMGGSEDWIQEVMLELEYPPDVAAPADLTTAIERAVWRLEKRVRKQMKSIPSPETVLSSRR